MYTVETVSAQNANPRRGYHAYNTMVQFRYSASSSRYVSVESFTSFVDHIALMFKTDMWCSAGAVVRKPIDPDDGGNGPADFIAVISHGYDSGD